MNNGQIVSGLVVLDTEVVLFAELLTPTTPNLILMYTGSTCRLKTLYVV